MKSTKSRNGRLGGVDEPEDSVRVVWNTVGLFQPYMLNVVWTSPVCPGSYYAGAACLWRVLHCAVLAGAAMTVSCVPAPCLYCEDVLVIFPGITSKHWPSLSEK